MRHRLLRVMPGACTVLGLVLLAGGCSSGSDDAGNEPSASPSESSSPSGGESAGAGATPAPGSEPDPVVEPPTEPMNKLEAPIAELLAQDLRNQGLTLDQLDCPEWDGKAPATLSCTGYFDGLTGEVAVSLTASRDGSVTFDANLQDGVIATANLVERLEEGGYTSVNCGERAGYSATIGRKIYCEVSRKAPQGTTTKTVVATVTDRSGSVRIEDY